MKAVFTAFFFNCIMKFFKYIAVFCLFNVLSACKYEEGPLISLKSRDTRLMRSWQLESKEINGVNQVIDNIEVLTFSKFGLFEAYYKDALGNETNYSGGWNFLNNDEDITYNKTRYYVDADGKIQQQVFQVIGKILRLTQKNFRVEYYDLDNNKIKEEYRAM